MIEEKHSIIEEEA